MSLATTEIDIGDETLTVWLATTDAERARGLMEVDRLPAGVDGMLFVFENPVSPFFHMASTPMELDIWWFDPDGLLIGTTRMEPCPQEPCPNYTSPGLVLSALETPAGLFDFEVGAALSTVETG